MTRFQRRVAADILVILSRGERPAIRQLANRLDVSLSSVQVGYAILERLGYIERRHRTPKAVKVLVTMVPASEVTFIGKAEVPVAA